MVRVEGVTADVAGGDPQDGYPGGSGNLLLQPVQVLVDGAGLPASVGEDGVIGLRENAVGGQGEQGAGLDAGTERDADERGRSGNQGLPCVNEAATGRVSGGRGRC
ncbi:hypothetical protein Srubr_38400 [Streptomyces rubradiris]|uniref:Uncharacterized protein n=1 Tax=Streptomyces rubradiris TaxID=285531 RepID=A0ABQ3RDS1_STRRR|nr:hypothetical protein Srubr_38400 [Streptomyces rubradiris]